MPAATPLPPCTVELASQVDTGDEWHQQHPTWIYRAIAAGSLEVRGEMPGEVLGDRACVIESHELGMIDIPDGRLVACDPYADGASAVAPFTHEVPPGEYPVLAAVATIGADHVRVLAALAVFESQPITRWTLGRTTEETVPGPFAVGEIVGFTTDAGVGCLASPQTLPALAEVLTDDGAVVGDPLSAAFASSPIEGVVAAPRADAGAIAMFRTGWGPGHYATWFGYGADGAVVLLLTDFALFADPWVPLDPHATG